MLSILQPSKPLLKPETKVMIITNQTSFYSEHQMNEQNQKG